MNSIPKARLVLYIIILGIFPILVSIFQLYTQNKGLSSLSIIMNQIQDTASLQESKQATNLAVRDHYINADHFYIDKYIESIPLLSQEMQILKKISEQNHLVEEESVKKRLAYLAGTNKINFTEGAVDTFSYFTETTESLLQSVEADTADIENILSKIEGVKIGEFSPGPNRPQLIFTDFKFEKKSLGENEVFLLNMKFLKREFF